MATVEKISIALPPELVTMIRGAVDTGEYASSSEVVRDALRDWTHKRKEVWNEQQNPEGRWPANHRSPWSSMPTSLRLSPRESPPFKKKQCAEINYEILGGAVVRLPILRC